MPTTLHADHIGSLLRPAELIEARRQHKAGKLSATQLEEAESNAILQALELQKQVGLEIYTDGEYRRDTFLDPLSQGMAGLERQSVGPRAPERRWQGPNSDLASTALEEFDTFVTFARDKLRRTGRLTGTEAPFMAKHSPGPWKITMPGPMLRASQMFRPGVSDKAYTSVPEVARDLAAAMAEEVKDLAADGASYLQLDSLLYVRPQPAADLAACIETDNIVLDAAKEAGLTVGLHMCRGNNRSSWLSEGSYEVSAEHAFSELHADRFLLEYDTDRAGGFEPLRFMPKDRVVVLGLISSKVPELETPDALQRRIDEAAKYVALENLGLSPQCGFASSLMGNLLSWDDQRRKLELVVSTAKRVWG